MSEYRDDTNEIMVAGDSVMTRTGLQADGFAQIGDVATYRLRVHVVDAASVHEVWSDNARAPHSEAVAASDTWTGAARGQAAGADAQRVADTLRLRVRAGQGDNAQAGDEVQGRVRSKAGDSVAAGEEWLGKRRVASFITDGASVADASLRRASAQTVDVLAAGDEQRGKLHATVHVVDALTAEAAEQLAADAGVRVLETLLASDTITGRLRAVQRVEDGVEVGEEFARDAGYQAQAWTANVRNWATSRYAPYTFDSVAVIKGVAYATTPEGVFALSGGAEDITARMETAKLDMSGGPLVHPLSVYLEYELDGAAALDVTTTQSGAPQTYTYPLAAEPAAALTNGRFILGRGLRGRHFTLALTLTGRRAHINDMVAYVEATKRRV